MTGRATSTRRIVTLAGDAILVAEFAAACQERGYTVECVAAAGGRGSRPRIPGLPKGARRVSRPSVRSSLAIELTNIDRDAKRRNLVLLDRTLRPGTLLLSSSVTVTVSEQSSWIKHPGRLAGIAALPGFLGGSFIECALSGLSGEGARQGAAAFAQSLGKEAAFVGDSVGMVLPRVVCCLANEAHFALMERIAAPEEIDTAMKLGTKYPFGPFEWARKIGYGQVYAVMHALHHSFGEDRYRPAPALRRAAEMEPLGDAKSV